MHVYCGERMGCNGGEALTGHSSQFMVLSLGLLRESPFNPRKRFVAKSLEELTESIREHGILTPLVARPVGDFFEIAAGHRRFRAATAAGLLEAPVMVRPMTDEQFMEVLTVENLQREDVHAYEEARGYQELLKLPGYDVAAVAGKIGRSESYVRSRLKLLDLAPEVADAFLADSITFAHARLIAPLSRDKQAEALEECFARFGRNMDKKELVPVSELREWIQSEQGEDLSEATFPLDDADLDPAAGACVTCPKSTCTAGKLFGDASADETCYDRKCFEAKTEAQIARQTNAGLVAISTAWDKKRDAPGALTRHEYTEIEIVEPEQTDPNGEDDEDDYRDPGERACEFMENAIVVSGHNRGESTKICRNPECPVHGKEAKQSRAKPNDAGSERGNEQRAEEDRQRKENLARRRDLYNALVDKWAPVIDRPVLFLLVVDGLDKIQHHPILTKIADELGVKRQTDISAQRAAIYTWAEKAGVLSLRAAFIRLFFAEHIEREEWHRKYDMLQIAAETLKDDLTESVAEARQPTQSKRKLKTATRKKPSPSAGKKKAAAKKKGAR